MKTIDKKFEILIDQKTWDLSIINWILYSANFFFVSIILLFSYIFLFKTYEIEQTTKNFDIYCLTSFLFIFSFIGQFIIVIFKNKKLVSDMLILIIFLYGFFTHASIYLKPNLLLIKSPITNRSIPIIEFIQWTVTCPLLYMSLFSSSLKLTNKSLHIVKTEHISIVISVLSIFIPNNYLHIVFVIIATFISFYAKILLLKDFYPAKTQIEQLLVKYVITIVFLYLYFPLIYFLGYLNNINQNTELIMYSLGDLIIKILYAVLLEYTNNKIQITSISNIIKTKKRETIEKMFIRYIFHEVRNPLSSLCMAIDDMKDTEQDQVYVHELQSGVNSLVRLLDDLKGMIELQEGRVNIEENILSMQGLISNCVTHMKDLYNLDDIIIQTNKKIPIIIADEYRISQLLYSCLFYCYQNKSKYPVNIEYNFTESYSTIYLTLLFSYKLSENTSYSKNEENEAKNILNFEISQIQLRPEIIDRDRHLEYSFGIRMAEYIVQLYMGNLNIKNNLDSCTITIDIQLAKHIIKKDIVNKVNIVKTNIAPLVLIVDDSKVQTKILQKILTEIDIKCVVVHNGQEAVNKVIENNIYDLIFMDIMMTEMNGVEATQLIKKIDPTITIIGMTANGFDSDIAEMEEAGAREVWIKPLKRDKIISTTKEIKAR